MSEQRVDISHRDISIHTSHTCNTQFTILLETLNLFEVFAGDVS